MGCDYYILKVLHIYYNDNDHLDIELDRERGYYDDRQFDPDEEDYEKKLNEYIEQTLMPKFDPILIYSNGIFKKSSCKSKYETLVENKINKHGKNWREIKKIVKVEERHER